MTPSNERFLKIQFKRLTLLKAAPQEPEAIRAWAESLEPVLIRVGPDEFSATVQRCIDKMEFFPMPSMFRERVHEPKAWREDRDREQTEDSAKIRAYQNSDEGKRDLAEFKAKMRELGLKYGCGKSEETA